MALSITEPIVDLELLQQWGYTDPTGFDSRYHFWRVGNSAVLGNTSLRIDPGILPRLHTCIGWILGMVEADQEKGVWLWNGFIQTLDRMANEPTNQYGFPDTIHVLGHDRYPLCFSWVRYQRRSVTPSEDPFRVGLERFHFRGGRNQVLQMPYLCDLIGGLVFTGFGSASSGSISLDSETPPWVARS